MSITGIILGVVGFLGALVTYSAQRTFDREHAILAERRKLYEECAIVVAAFMFKKVNVNSEQHFNRRDKLNIMGQRLEVLAPNGVRSAYRAVVEQFSLREKSADIDGNVEIFFDEKMKALIDDLLEAMRHDALPKTLWRR